MAEPTSLTTSEKVLSLNLDESKYGTFAEIGAGQEVANWFFRTSATAGTVAKAMSAYDMTFSDSIYGECKRYVSRDRLIQMLDHEYQILLERLAVPRGENCTFFVFANTVRAMPFDGKGECHGWLGVRLQLAPLSEHHDILIHVRMLDRENFDQMEALGIVGVNLIYAAFNHRDNLGCLTRSLLDGLSKKRLEIDMLKFSGPGFQHIDNRLCALELVANELTDAALFTPSGEVVQPAEVFYRKPVLLIRGAFHPVTKIHLDMLEGARAEFAKSLDDDAPEFLEVMETTMDNLLETGIVDKEEFLQRADVMQALGKTVLISRFAEFHRLTSYLARYTKCPTGIALGVGLLREIFDEKWYEDLEGGTLEALGKLFRKHVKLCVYPGMERGERIDLSNLSLPHHLRSIFDHFKSLEQIVSIECKCEDILEYTPSDVRKMKERGDNRWLELVPEEAH
ncbi:MAG: TonB-dependent receptor [Verrucomicrobiales bacterium]|jgi:hypothetical protein